MFKWIMELKTTRKNIHTPIIDQKYSKSDEIYTMLSFSDFLETLIL